MGFEGRRISPYNKIDEPKEDAAPEKMNLDIEGTKRELVGRLIDEARRIEAWFAKRDGADQELAQKSVERLAAIEKEVQTLTGIGNESWRQMLEADPSHSTAELLASWESDRKRRAEKERGATLGHS